MNKVLTAVVGSALLVGLNTNESTHIGDSYLNLSYAIITTHSLISTVYDSTEHGQYAERDWLSTGWFFST